MGYITLTTELTPEGVVCEHEALGKVATIIRENGEWFVRPYRFPIYERGAKFKSYAAAEFYALALGYEMMELEMKA